MGDKDISSGLSYPPCSLPSQPSPQAQSASMYSAPPLFDLFRAPGSSGDNSAAVVVFTHQRADV